MLTAVVVLLRSIGLLCRGHRAVALENLALRQQLAALTRTAKRPQLRLHDRLFWILLRNSWRDWRSALLIVRPDTVLRWHRQWLRHRWTTRSLQKRSGRPRMDAAILALIDKMVRANPLWGAPRIHGGVAQAGHRGLGTNRLAVHPWAPATSITDVANLPRESHLRAGLDGLLHGADGDRPRAVSCWFSSPLTDAASSK
jgi:hypothetical protein